MGYIKEPKGVDFIVAPTVLTAKDKEEISTYIGNYKKNKSTQVLAEPLNKYEKSKIKTPKP